MDLIVQWEAHRIKSLALIVMLPYLSGDLVQKYLGAIGKLLFSRLEDELYYKLSEQKSRANYSPSHFSNSGKEPPLRQYQNPRAYQSEVREDEAGGLAVRDRPDGPILAKSARLNGKALDR